MPISDWFADAKLGIFVHYGIYSVEGMDPSWEFFRGTVSYDDYLAQRHRFTAASYDPREWADLFAAAGARYAVLTSKHHDGVALFDAGDGNLSTTGDTPAGRDLVAPFAAAMRDAGLRVGLYFSLADWSHPDYASTRPGRVRYEEEEDNRFAYSAAGEEDPEAWERFLSHVDGQLAHLQTAYGTIDLIWFDGGWERDAVQWDSASIRSRLLGRNADVVLNDRLPEGGDYATPEQGLPVRRPSGPWELCATIGDGWTWRPEHTEKTVRQVVRLLTQVASKGGNLLLNAAPREDGSIDETQRSVLLGLGAWLHRHGEAIYGSRAGLPDSSFYGPTTTSADGTSVFLFCLDTPVESIELRGVRQTPTRVTVVGRPQLEVGFRVTPGLGVVPGQIYIDVPAEGTDETATVFRVDFAEPVTTYEGDGGTEDRNRREDD